MGVESDACPVLDQSALPTWAWPPHRQRRHERFYGRNLWSWRAPPYLCPRVPRCIPTARWIRTNWCDHRVRLPQPG